MNPYVRGYMEKTAVTLEDLRKATETLKRSGVVLKLKGIGPAAALHPARIAWHGDPIRHFGRIGYKVPRNLSPEAREAIGRTTLMHEGLELKALRRLGKPSVGGLAGIGSHASPSVLLGEHNILTAYQGPERKQLIQMLRNLRTTPKGFTGELTAPEEVIISRLLGREYRHGVSPRFSRHAIKRIEDIRKGIPVHTVLSSPGPMKAFRYKGLKGWMARRGIFPEYGLKSLKTEPWVTT